MSVIKKMRRQKAVYWKRGEADKYGAFSFDPPVEIDCRWDDKGEEYRDMKGQVAISNATVYPDRVMYPGDKLMKGEMESDTPESPLDLIDAHEIQRFEQIPNFKATETLFIAYL